MKCPDCKGCGQHPANTQCGLCRGHGHDNSGHGWPLEDDPPDPPPFEYHDEGGG